MPSRSGAVPNRDLRAARRADTEVRIIEAATALFTGRGYVATALADVATGSGRHQAIGGFFRKLAADGLISSENVDWVVKPVRCLARPRPTCCSPGPPSRRSRPTSRGRPKPGHDSQA
jgi:hypothetical protein